MDLLAKIGFCVILLFNASVSLALFDILLMFLGHPNPKLCPSVNAIVVNLCKITEPKKKIHN